MHDMAETAQKAQAGFTLIELVIVITIIGILAAYALPKFAALQADARVAKMNGALGSVKSAAMMAHALLIARGLDTNFTGTPTPAIVVEGTTIVFVNGYPDAASVVALAGVSAADFVIAGLAAPAIVAADLSHNGVSGNPNCTIGYTTALANNQPTYVNNATLANCT